MVYSPVRLRSIRDSRPFLRFQRHYKPYTIKLLDVRKDDYVASDTPRNYSSDIQLVDKTNGVDKPVHIHDLNATILHCLGINHEKLTYKFQGRDFRLTDVEGKVVKDILS